MVESKGLIVEPQTYRSSPYATKIVSLAADEIQRQWGVNYINPEFLLAAVVAEGSSYVLFEEQGISIDTVTQGIVDVVKPQFKPSEGVEPIADPWGRLTNRSRRVLFEAERKAIADSRDINGSDMLHGMVQEGESYAYKILSGLNFQLEANNPQE